MPSTFTIGCIQDILEKTFLFEETFAKTIFAIKEPPNWQIL